MTGQQHPKPPITPEANARARAEGQTITFEQAGQQYPTREQVAEVLYASDGDPEREGDDLDWTGETDALRHVYLNNADAVLALIQNGADR